MWVMNCKYTEIFVSNLRCRLDPWSSMVCLTLSSENIYLYKILKMLVFSSSFLWFKFKITNGEEKKLDFTVKRTILKWII